MTESESDNGSNTMNENGPDYSKPPSLEYVENFQKLFDEGLVITGVHSPLLRAVDVEQEHPRFGVHYKNWYRIREAQQRRRIELIEAQKLKRDERIAQLRGFIAEVAQKGITEEDLKKPENDESYTRPIPRESGTFTDVEARPIKQPFNYRLPRNRESPTPSTQSADSPCANESVTTNASSGSPANTGGTRRRSNLNKFRNKIMLSEWMIDRPSNFESEWVFKAVPIGKRCLIVSSNGQTVAYSRTGVFLKTFQSQLPGGHQIQADVSEPQWKNSAILDCIYHSQRNTFFILDIISWNDVKLYESEAQLRFFWIESRFLEEKRKLTEISPKNECLFYPLIAHPATEDEILKAVQLSDYPELKGLSLDGLLFFFKTALYVPGVNPLTLWLKPDMIKPVLGIRYKTSDSDQQPDNYVMTQEEQQSDIEVKQ